MFSRSALTLDLDPSTARAVLGALAPELRSPPEGTSVEASRCGDGASIELVIASSDLSSHRAAMNSYLGLLQATISSLRVPFEKNK